MQIMAGSQNGGAENFFVRLSLSLSDYNISQKIITRPNDFRISSLRSLNLPVKETRFGGVLDYGTDKLIRDEYNKFSPQIVLSWMNRATFHTSRSLKKKNFIHIGRLGGYYNLKYYKNCSHLIANTRGILDWLEKSSLSHKKLHYLPNFVEGNFSKNFVSNSRKEEKITKIFSAGRLHTNKGFDVLIKSIVGLDSVYLTIAGDGPLSKELILLTERLGISHRVEFLGWKEELSALYEDADIFVCPSRHEPLGNVIIEAWANKLPVIAANSQGPSELIEAGHNGMLFPIDDVRSLYLTILDLLNDRSKRNKIAENGYSKFKRNFTKEIVTKKYYKFFQRVISECAE